MRCEAGFDERPTTMMRLLFSTLLMLASVGTAFAAERPNVLFIAVDDLRSELSCYGKQHCYFSRHSGVFRASSHAMGRELPKCP